MDGSTDAPTELSIQARLKLLSESGQASEAVVAFARKEVTRMEQDLGVSLETEGGGMLVNHLVLALQRARNGTSYVAPDGVADLIASELRDRPDVRDRARVLAARAREELEAALPDTEVDFLAVHLAALAEADEHTD